jgi:hypothetical protein
MRDTGRARFGVLSRGTVQKLWNSPTYARGVTAAKAPELNISHAHLQRPLMYPQELRDIGDGYMVYFGHQIEGTMRCYLPFRLKGMEAIDALDPAA